MNEIRRSISLSPDLEFSYSQFFVYDAGLTSPACEWTETHSKQGFARRECAVAIGTLLEFGTANVVVTFGTPSNLEPYERVLAVPLEVKTGAVSIDGPEESGGKRVVVAASGHYRATVAQRAVDDSREDINIWLEKVDVPIRHSELLVVDEALDPPAALLETANTPS
jgi:hypothetical protein